MKDHQGAHVADKETAALEVEGVERGRCEEEQSHRKGEGEGRLDKGEAAKVESMKDGPTGGPRDSSDETEGEKKK